MRTLSSALILIAACPQVGADDGAKQPVDVVHTEVGTKQTLVATVFGVPLYLEDLTPPQAESKHKELPQAEFVEWLYAYRGARAYETICAAVTRKYIEDEKLGVTKVELAGIVAAVERQWKTAPQQQEGNTLTPEMRKGMMVAMQRASLQDWKLSKSLYEKYGGRVGMGNLGAWIAFDAQNALLQRHYKANEIKFHHAEMEKAFWKETRKESFADTYPTDKRLRWLLATPPYMWDLPGDTSAEKAKVD